MVFILQFIFILVFNLFGSNIEFTIFIKYVINIMRLCKSCIIFLLCLFPEILIAQGKRIALVIGNNNYAHATPLQNPVNDANAIAQNLKVFGFEVLHYTNLDQKGLKQAIDLFGEKLKNFEVSLFYYAGHGIQLNGYNYLVPVDANLSTEEDAEYDCVDAGRILSKMEISGTKTNIIILDACRNNPFERGWSRSFKKTGLAFMDAPTGSLIAYSTSPGNTASEGNGKNGLYTTYLLKSMINPDLNILKVFQEVRKNVREASNGKQVPWESTSLENDFYFNQTGKVLSNVESLKIRKEKRPGEKDSRIIMDKIKSDTSLICCEASGNTLAEADKLAAEEFNNMLYGFLKKKILANDPLSEISNTQEKGVQLIIDEFGSITQRKVVEKKKGLDVIRYLSKHELNLNLDLRKNRIIAFSENAVDAEKSLRIADALKNYYWAYTLSIIYPGPVKTSVNGNTYKSLSAFLEKHIPEVIKSISFYAIDSTYNDVSKSFRIQFYSNEKPLQNVNFRYWNGVTWSDIIYSNNGTAIIEIDPSYSINNLKISIEYANIIESKFDPYLNKSLQLTFNNPFKDERNVTFQSEELKKESTISAGVKKVINDLLMYLQDRNLKYDNELFTAEGFEAYKKLLVYGNASILKIEDNFTSYSMGKLTFVRGIPCTFSFQNNSVKFSENLCIELNAEGKIQNITFSLSDTALKDIMSQERWPISSRLQIIHFLENYKTAYALKRYDYIEKIFSDKALIIVGEKIEESEQIDGSKYSLTGDNYEYIRLTKEQYLSRLRKVFSKNEFINIRFEENIVKKRDNQSEVYGINIRQNYFSSNYADQGYLFLMVDMADSAKPMIYVRSWQPLKSFNGHRINLSDFTY